MKIAITAPVFVKNNEHLKFLDLTTKSFHSEDHDLFWIPVENYIEPTFRPISYVFKQEPDEVIILQGRQPQSVSGAWNDGITRAGLLEADYVLVINTDIVFKKNAIDRLVAFAEAHPEAVMWTMSEYADLAFIEECPEDEGFNEHPHFSCFMVKPSILEQVGLFDENFQPAYCEDADYHARITLLGHKAYTYGGARFYHFGSRTIKSDNELWMANSLTFPKCQQYFLDKWGHPVVNEVDDMRRVYYKTPYNEPNYSLTDWKRLAP